MAQPRLAFACAVVSAVVGSATFAGCSGDAFSDNASGAGAGSEDASARGGAAAVGGKGGGSGTAGNSGGSAGGGATGGAAGAAGVGGRPGGAGGGSGAGGSTGGLGGSSGNAGASGAGGGGSGPGGSTGAGGSAGANCEDLREAMQAKLDAAKKCCAACAPAGQCIGIKQGACCYETTNLIDSPESIAYEAAFLAWANAGCQAVCPAALCPVVPSQTCVTTPMGDRCR